MNRSNLKKFDETIRLERERDEALTEVGRLLEQNHRLLEALMRQDKAVEVSGPGPIPNYDHPGEYTVFPQMLIGRTPTGKPYFYGGMAADPKEHAIYLYGIQPNNLLMAQGLYVLRKPAPDAFPYGLYGEEKPR